MTSMRGEPAVWEMKERRAIRKTTYAWDWRGKGLKLHTHYTHTSPTLSEPSCVRRMHACREAASWRRQPTTKAVAAETIACSVPTRGRSRADAAGAQHSCGLVLRSIGWKAAALASVPFDDARAFVPSAYGRVAGTDGGAAVWSVRRIASSRSSAPARAWRR